MLWLWLGWALAAPPPERVWATLKEQDTVEAYRTYLHAYPDGPYAEQARGRLDELAWAEATSADTAEAYRRYLNLNPSGAQAQEATYRWQAREFAEAIATGRTEPLEDFLLRHRGSALAVQAREALDSLRFQAASSAGDPRALVRYASLEAAHSAEALALPELNRYQDACRRGQAQVWIAYLRDYPSGAYSDAARASLAALQFRRLHVVVVVRQRAGGAQPDAFLAEVVDFTVARPARKLGFEVMLSVLEDLDDPDRRVPPRERVQAVAEEGVLVVDLWEEEVYSRYSTAPVTRYRAELGLFPPGAEQATWSTRLETISQPSPGRESTAELRKNAQERLGSALLRSGAPLADHVPSW
jgi:hypothetical protein